MKARLLVSIGTTVAALASSAVLATTSSAATIPSSPDGIHDARLCSGSSYFVVDDGTYAHAFTPEGADYITGGIQRHWNETVWWPEVVGVLEVAAYRFSVDCY